jgi:hypothetical protein
MEKYSVCVHRFMGSRFHSRPWTAFGMCIYQKSVSFVRPNPKLAAKLAITDIVDWLIS